MNISFGANVADDGELRLCGDISGKRVIELGVSSPPNAVAMARLGAKAIAVDPDPRAIDGLRLAADRAEVRVECHQGDLADLGFATSASVDLVLAAHSLGGVDDLPRVLRQVHRVLKPGSAFVVAATHPVAVMFDQTRTANHVYAHGVQSFAELYMAFERANFHFEVVLELNDDRVHDPLCPSVLVLRARKLGV
jgi:SAM-dependent methyltransferase